MSMSREELEDAAAGARDVGRVARSAFDAFIEAGFNHYDAMQLTTTWLEAAVRGNIESEDNDDQW